MEITRRRFTEATAASLAIAATPAMQGQTIPEEDSHIGSLYEFVQKQADTARQEYSFLRTEYTDLAKWKPAARKLVLDRLYYEPAKVSPNPSIIEKADRGDYLEEYLTFSTTPDIRAPAYVLIPKKREGRVPGIVAMHDHGGFYLWGKEKLVEQTGENPVLTAFRQTYYSGKSIAIELVRQGYAVLVIDMFYWGERRMLFSNDPENYRTRPASLSKKEINTFNRRCGSNEPLVARSLLAAGTSWPGVMLWDDIRSVDYLSQRPEVDPKRLGCVGLSVGGYRSFLLAALDERIRTAVSVGWMTSFPKQIKRHINHTVGFSFHIPGLLKYLDLPDLSALIAPRALLNINGAKDTLFNQEGIQAAYSKIRQCYEKAGAPERQRCLLYDTPHEFNSEMQEEAWSWLRRWL